MNHSDSRKSTSSRSHSESLQNKERCGESGERHLEHLELDLGRLYQECSQNTLEQVYQVYTFS